MSTYKDDLKGAKQLINEDYGSLGYHKVYYSSNEYLPQLFNQFSIKDKDVFTVVGSGDQVLYSYYKGARSVDTYDINILTKYYYYLRKWCLEETKEFYLSAKDDALIKAIKKHYDENEFAAKLWLEVIIISYFLSIDISLKISNSLKLIFLSLINSFNFERLLILLLSQPLLQ